MKDEKPGRSRIYELVIDAFYCIWLLGKKYNICTDIEAKCIKVTVGSFMLGVLVFY